MDTAGGGGGGEEGGAEGVQHQRQLLHESQNSQNVHPLRGRVSRGSKYSIAQHKIITQ